MRSFSGPNRVLPGPMWTPPLVFVGKAFMHSLHFCRGGGPTLVGPYSFVGQHSDAEPLQTMHVYRAQGAEPRVSRAMQNHADTPLLPVGGAFMCDLRIRKGSFPNLFGQCDL